MKSYKVLGAIIDLLFIAFLIVLIVKLPTLGVIFIAVWGVTFFTLPGTFLRELEEEEPKKLHLRTNDPQYAQLVGTEVTVVADLRPQGLVQAGDDTIQAKSEGDFIPSGRQVTVTDTKSDYVIVKEVKPDSLAERGL